jgi:beta-lactamase class A
MPLNQGLFDRRRFIGAGTALALVRPALAAPSPFATKSPFAAIEARAEGRLGVFALDTGGGRALAYRADARFPMCSTFKLLLAAFVLSRIDAGRERLDRRVAYGAADLLDYAPTARAHLAEGAMTVADLCAAAVQLSDNTAANLLLRETGGPAALTAWLRHIGDPTTRLDNNEPTLNVWAAGEVHDTTTPAAVVATWRMLLLGAVLSPASRARLIDWAKGTTTGLARIRAGVPKDWVEGDKTGSWSDARMGTSNDIAILWPPGRAPIILAVFLALAKVSGDRRDAAVAEVGRIVADLYLSGRFA